ncbi:TonB-dependent receptor [Novosphingobium sp. SG707]|uniref:TonB-dependent receptor n=1 Tax=Novosphingobium sp. SG707 TaxID=2586996 RepID=UPI001FF09342|nr:TonB-dependent receptor [Novosphingobium sp. SG707]
MMGILRVQRSLGGSVAAWACALGIASGVGVCEAWAQTDAPPVSPAPRASAALTTEPADAGTAGEIIVTANKRRESLMNVAASVTALSGTQLVSKGIYDVQDLVKVTPGLSYVESGRSVPVFSLRGVGFFDTSIAARPTVSVYVDEAPLPFSIEAKGSAFDLERVEVLKGPQGTLFGQNATGGAINYIAAKPTDSFHAGFVGSFGRFNTADVQGYVSGPLSSTLDGRIAVRTVQSGDWQRSYTRNDSQGAQHFTQGRVMLAWRPTDKLKVALNVNGWIDKSETQAPQFQAFIPGTARLASATPLLASYPVAPANPRAADWDPGKAYRSDSGFVQANLRMDYAVSRALTLTSITSYAYARIRQMVDADGTNLTNIDSEMPGELKSISQELRGAGDLGPVSYILGVNYAKDDTHQQQAIQIPYSTTALSVNAATPLDNIEADLRQHFDTKAAFVNVDLHATNRLTFHGGIRYTQANLNYDGCTFALDDSSASAFTQLANKTRASQNLPPLTSIPVGQCATLNPQYTTDRYFNNLDQHNLSWRGGVDFKPTPNTLLYANVSKGYKAGSSSTPTATNDLQYSPASQESVLAYEAGIKTTLLDRKLEFTAAAFYYDYRDKQVLGRQVFQPNVFGALNALTNVPKSEIDGAEAQISVFPIHGLTLSAAGTYLHSKVLGSFVNADILGNTVDFQGNAFPYTPTWQVVFDGEYRFAVGGGRTAILGGNANYRSQTTSGFGGNGLLAIDAYWLLDLRAGMEFGDGRYRVQVYGKNVTNQYYWTNVARAVDNVRRYAGMPATYGIQFSVKY